MSSNHPVWKVTKKTVLKMEWVPILAYLSIETGVFFFRFGILGSAPLSIKVLIAEKNRKDLSIRVVQWGISN